jgi:hypothetical protein
MNCATACGGRTHLDPASTSSLRSANEQAWASYALVTCCTCAEICRQTQTVFIDAFEHSLRSGGVDYRRLRKSLPR